MLYIHFSGGRKIWLSKYEFLKDIRKLFSVFIQDLLIEMGKAELGVEMRRSVDICWWLCEDESGPHIVICL